MLADLETRAWIYSSYKIILTADQIQEYFVAHQLSYIYLGINHASMNPGWDKGNIMNIFWPDPKNNLASRIWHIDICAFFWDLNFYFTSIDVKISAILNQTSREEIHGW